MKINKCKLGDLLRIKQGYAFKSEKYVSQSQYRLCTLGNFGENNAFKFNDAKATYYPDDFSKDFLLHEGDLVLPLTEQTVGLFGNSAFIPRTDGYSFVLNQRVGKVIPKQNADIVFLHYLLSTPLVRDQIEATASGTKQRNTSPEKIYDVDVWVPELETQRRIGLFLHQFEKKIDINNQILLQLDSMSKLIYDYWFIQFDFPDKTGNPYKSSGGSMIWDEQLKQLIPKGWKCGTVNSLLKIDNVIVTPKKRGDTLMEHYSIPAFDTNHYPAYEVADTIESNKYAVDSECILTSKLNPHFKRLWDPHCNTQNAICSTEFIVYRPRVAWTRPFCYAVLNSDAFYYHMSSKATSSTGSRKRIQPDVSASFELPIPDERTMRSFVELYGPIMEKQKALYKENRELTKLRDWLLPMLMNGQATVADSEEEVSKIIPFAPQTVEVRQAARNFGDKKTDDTADLVKAFMRRKKNDSKA